MKTNLIKEIVDQIKKSNIDGGRVIINEEYPYHPIEVAHRSYTVKQRYAQFCKDGFIDRYSGERLVNPGILKVISHYYPEEFPYHPHWKMSETHTAYWELSPTIDHIVPIATGGEDDPTNWVTASMMNNMIKSNWTLEQMRWSLHPSGDLREWDGLTGDFIELISLDKGLLNDNYIKTWYRVSCESIHDPLEDYPAFKSILEEVRSRAMERVNALRETEIAKQDGDEQYQEFLRGLPMSHQFAYEVQRILREEYDIEWKSVIDLNPRIQID